MRHSSILAQSWKVQAGVLCALLILLVPGPLEAVAASIGFEKHVVSFLIGPALYAFGDRLVPGIDYFTQYSVGQPFLFSYLLAPTAAGTMIRYAGWIVVAMYLFYAGMFYFLWWLYRNWQLAAGITLLVLMSSFHTERPFFDPSSFPLRYPLLFVWLALMVRQSRFAASSAWMIALGVVIGFSLFLNTETGLYMLLATGLVNVAAAQSVARGSLRYVAILVLTVASFTLLCLLAFGQGIFDARFFKRLVEPFFIYGEGFGAWPVYWDFGWHLLYNVVSPGVALATMGWTIVMLRSRAWPQERTRLVALLAASCIAIMMSVKYWNMSIAALWLVNAVLFWVVMAWWTMQVLAFVTKKQFSTGGYSILPIRMIKWTLVIAAVFFVAVVNDTRNPTFYGLEAYEKYPGLLKRVLSSNKDSCLRMDCAVPRISPIDVELITTMTNERQRVAIYSPIDWAYLIEAKRAPHFEFVPSHATFTQRQLKTATTGFDLIFLPRTPASNHGIDQPELGAILVPLLDCDFEIVAVGEALVAWKRKTLPVLKGAVQ